MHVCIEDNEGNDRKNDPKHGAMPTKPNHANEAELVAAMAEMDAKEEASYRASRFATEQHPLDGPGLTPSRCRQRQLYHRLMSDWYGHKLGEIQR
ncbi:hypothetical protein [Sinorhizobium medicae]|uniref:hypothetical protein n=1 Tax=Sinorhizobium medicae TaxID=110321 RepID=UPI000FE0D692|nr:hypothetical protein [Sinorhizobium medicae]RVJ00933.1 hypothetical protein CN183_26060 [Sinorhizobium medicae]